MFRKPFTFLCFVFLVSCSLFAAPPIINYAGQVRVAGQAFSGVGYLKFAFVNSAGNITYWSNDGTSTAGTEPSGSVDVQVRGGLYSILLGNTAIEGMSAIDPFIFQQYSDIHIRVWFNDGVRGFQHLRPDQPFSSVPYALSAGSAMIAPGSITLNMLGSDVQSSLGATIDRSRLSEDVKADLNRTIGEEQLSVQVTEKLNRDISIQPGSIGKTLLAAEVLNDLNRTITLGDLDPQVVADLNDSVADGSISYAQLTGQVRADLNRTVVLADLSPEVVAEINATIGLDRLSSEVTALLNRTINKSMLGSDVLGDLNATIDRSRLSADVLADLNRTFSEEDLSVDVLQKIQLAPSISTQPFARYKWGTDSVTIEVKGNGYQLSYQWFQNNVLIEGEAHSIIEITNPDFDANHSYTVKLFNTYGEVNSSAVKLKDALGVPDPSSNEYNYLITDDLLIHLPFDETSGNIAHDVSGNSYHLEITGFDGATAAWRQGKIGGAFSFDGEDDWGSVPVVLEDNFTKSVWLKTLYAEGYSTQWNYDSFYDRYVGAVSGASQTYGLILNYGKIGFWIGSSGNTWSDPRLYSSIHANSGTWHHFVARREGNETDGNYSLFVNGNLDKSVSFTKQITYGSNTYIGRTFNSSLYYDGEMDDLRIYGRALSNAEIQGLYNLGSDPNAIHSYPGAGSGISFVPKEDSITTEHLSEQILKYLRPEITQSPVLTKDREQVYTGQTITLSSDAEGKFLSYQWLKDGEPVPGATNREFTITDANGSLHNGNYTVQVSNDFGMVSSEVLQIDINDTQLIHQIDLTSTVSLEMIWVEPGTFTMGQDGVATPVHEVTLSNGFYLGKYEVTQAQYEAVMTGNSDGLSATPSNFASNPNRPVEKVSWDDVQVFLTRLNAQEGGNIPAGWAYVLPTEAQWEYACRAGTTTAYSWGDTITTSDANYNYTIGQTTNVGSYSANPWGFFDMHGNVWEWTSDWYATYSSGSVTDPEGPATGSYRVYRGGSWGDAGTGLRSAVRSSYYPSHRNRGIGFRVGFQQIPADVASPEMQIFGDANITHFKDTAWVDPGVEAHDVRDGNITDSITVSGTVDVNTTGTYTLTYTVSDAAGNAANITRTVNVVEGQASTHTADLNSTVSLEMIWVEPGTFNMGQDGDTYAEPQHEVTLTKGFYLGKYEVTQAQYEAVMTDNNDNLSATPSMWPNNPDRPVDSVSWDDIQKFLTRLNVHQAGNIPTGWAYVLPTEAQWEYACRAGTTTAYSWGDTITSDDANYNWDGNWNTGADFQQTRDVGQYSANPWGFFDMLGNLWEWTADAWGTFESGAKTDPFSDGASGSFRVSRGGSWIDTGSVLRSALRDNFGPSDRTNLIGFRLGFQQIPADLARPEMQIYGDANITHLQNTAWVDPGVEAHDVWEGNITSNITVSGTVDVNTTGTYTLTYTVSNAAGNQASITRTVNVEKNNNNDYRGVDISSMDFSGQDLSDALFDSTTIFSNGSSGVNFSGTGLKLDNLSGSIDLRGVNLDGVDLRGSDLSGAYFDEFTVVTNANLAGTGALFSSFTVDISGANVAGLDFTGSGDLVMSYSTVLTEYDDELGKYNGANISRSGGYYSGRGGYENINGLPLDLRGVNVSGLDLSRMYREQIYSVSFDSDTIFSTYELGGASLGLVDEDGNGGWGGSEGISLPNLSGPIDLSGVNLSYVDLTGSDLSQAIISSSTVLMGANLYGTGLALPPSFDIHSGSLDIRGANVAGLNLSNGSSWGGPSLRVSSATIFTVEESGGFYGANISGCSFSEDSEELPTDLRGVNIVGVDLQPTVPYYLNGWPLFDSSTIFSDGFTGASLGADQFGNLNAYQFPVLLGLSGPVDLRGVNLSEVDLNGEEGFASGSGFGPSDLSEALFNPSVTLFIGANFSGTNANFPVGEYNFSNANITGIDLTGCMVRLSNISVIRGANFTEAILIEEGWGALSNMDFSGVNLTGVNLSNLNLSNAVFDSNTVFSDTIYSESTTYFPDGFDPTQYPGLIAQ